MASTTSYKRRLTESQAAVEKAEMALVKATNQRDDEVLRANLEDGISLAEIGRILNVRRETAHYAKLRAAARQAEGNNE